MENLNYPTDHFLYPIFKIILNISQKKLEKSNDNPLIKIYVNKTENKITFKIKKRALSSTFNS